MSSKEDYLDSLLQTVNASSTSGSGTAIQKLADIQEENTGEERTQTDVGKRSVSGDDEFDSEDLEFPELAALFADKTEEEAELETEDEMIPVSETSNEEAVSQAAEMSLESLIEGADDLLLNMEDISMVDSNGAETAMAEVPAGEAVLQEMANVPAVEETVAAIEERVAPLKDIEDMDIAELEAMLSGMPIGETTAIRQR